MATAHPLLVAVDVDGTLLNTEFDDVLAEREILAMDAVREAGHVLVLATGRNTNSLRRLLEKSGWDPPDLPLVLLNGALVFGGTPRQRLAYHTLAGQEIRQLIALFREHGTVPMVYDTEENDGVLHHETREVNDVLGRYLTTRRRNVGAIHPVPDLLALDWREALEVGTIDVKERIMALTEAIGRELDGKIRVVNTRSLLGEGKYYWAEAFHREGDKGQGVTQLAEIYGIARNDIVALGDNYNDLGMFAAAGVSVAMGNSPDEVKAAAGHLTGHVADGGAAVILQDIAANRFPGPAQPGGAPS